jgi:hypothetical protein
MTRTIKSAAFLSSLIVAISLAGADAATSSGGAPAATNRNAANSAVDRQKKASQDDAQKTLINDAVVAISETQKASDALSKGDSTAALAALERATGKLDLLLARNPSTALLPVRVETIAVESAPADIATIKQISDRAQRAVAAKDYPLARVLLGGLQDEIRVRTYNLPLATYPQAIKDAARLIDQKKIPDASNVLTTALSTLVLVDHVFPEPTIKAQAAVQVAESLKTKDKAESLRLVDSAKQELARAEALGYAGKDDPEFSALQASVENVDKQLRTDHGLVSFDDLKSKLANFFKHQSQTGKSNTNH